MTDWFVDSKLSAFIFFNTKHKIRDTNVLNIVYNGAVIKEYLKVKYLGYNLDESVPG